MCSNIFKKSIKTLLITVILLIGLTLPFQVKAQSFESGVLGASVLSFNNSLYVDGTQIESPTKEVETKSDQPLFSGYTIGDVSVTLIINSTTIERKVTSDNKGFWQYQLDQKLEPGVHTLKLNITDQSGKSSGEYLAATFVVSNVLGAATSSANLTPAPSLKTVNYFTITLSIFILILLLLLLYLLLKRLKKKNNS
jgi:hypothetical protein